MSHHSQSELAATPRRLTDRRDTVSSPLTSHFTEISRGGLQHELQKVTKIKE